MWIRFFWITLLDKIFYVTYLCGLLYPSDLDNFIWIKFTPLHCFSTAIPETGPSRSCISFPYTGFFNFFNFWLFLAGWKGVQLSAMRYTVHIPQRFNQAHKIKSVPQKNRHRRWRNHHQEKISNSFTQVKTNRKRKPTHLDRFSAPARLKPHLRTNRAEKNRVSWPQTPRSGNQTSFRTKSKLGPWWWVPRK